MAPRKQGGKPRDLPTLRARLDGLRLRGEVQARARSLLLVWLDAAIAQGVPFDEVLRALKSGVAARTIAAAELQRIGANPPDALLRAACAPGCAFCCLLPGDDGGTILGAEARALHPALVALRGQPDGSAWHPDACPVLDPQSRMCRAYDARPMLCRAYFSTDAGACEANAMGQPVAGAAVLGSQGLMLSVQSVARAALAGVATLPSYALARFARATLDGADLTEALRISRHAPRMLEDERKRLTGG